MRIKAVLFDIDGTLVDSNDLHVAAWTEAFAAQGHRFDAQTLHDQIGKGADMLVPTLLPGTDAATAERFGSAHGEIFADKYLHRVAPFADARALLEHVRASGRQVVLASSASQSEVDHHLDLLDLRDIVTATTSADDVEHSKPAPDIFIGALAKVAPLRVDEVLVVGDTPYDVQAARAAGIACVAVRSGGFADDVLLGAGAVALYDDVAAILADFGRSPLGR